MNKNLDAKAGITVAVKFGRLSLKHPVQRLERSYV